VWYKREIFKTFSPKILNKRYNFGNTAVECNIILKLTLKKLYGNVWTDGVGLKIRARGKFL